MNIPLPQKNNRQAGMTLVEMMVSVAIGSVVLAAVGLLIVYTARSFVALGNYNDLDQASRNALDVMSRDIRQTKGLFAYATNALRFVDKDGINDLRYVWNPNTRTLTRFKGMQSQILLEQCNFLRFGISQRNPSNNFSFYPTLSPATAKLVDVSWTCSRRLIQTRVNTESVQTAKIVIRN